MIKAIKMSEYQLKRNFMSKRAFSMPVSSFVNAIKVTFTS